MNNRILKMYQQIDEKVDHQFTEFESIVYNIIMKHSVSELELLGKVLGGRINDALNDAMNVAPKTELDKFKKAVAKGMK